MKEFFSIRISVIFLFLWIIPGVLWAQRAKLYGHVSDSVENPVIMATISVPEFSTGTTTDSLGYYEMNLPAQVEFTLVIQHLNYERYTLSLSLKTGEERSLNVMLSALIRVLDSVAVTATTVDEVRDQVSVYTIEPKTIENLPTPFNDFSKVLVTLPGVVSNNELSSTYSVRGGNFDENLVYVNDIPVYRPFLIRSGEQEGLSFINPDLTREVQFSSGGWQASYGDALSSSLNVDYKTPETFEGTFSIGLLGGSLHLGGSDKKDRLSFVAGVRHKRSEYLLNTLEVEGQYFPRYTDIQSYIRYKLNGQLVASKPKTELGLLLAFAKNRYNVLPESRETTFGTFDQPLNIYMAFIGQELLNYNTYQGALKLTHRYSEKISSDIIFSNYYTQEREYFDVEAGYRICDVDKRPESETFNKCINIRGIGTEFTSARNKLDAYILNAEVRNEWIINNTNRLSFGIGYAYQHFDDHLHEYSFIDSADYVTISELISGDNNTLGNVINGYVQHNLSINRKHIITYGLRFNYLDINKNFLISPRFQYSFIPEWHSDIVFRGAFGLYQQQPFYREFRRFDGSLNLSVNAQKSYHAIAGMDYNFSFWGRPFKFILEAYYKYLDDIIPYDLDNVRIRYFGDNLAKGYATGIDFRVSGEFVPGDESWFSLGFLSTKEDLENDNRGMIPRPSDQLINFNIFFQDHLPRNPTYRVYLNLNYASGLPFGPPNNIEYRNIFKGDSYQRVDLGLSKIFFINRNKSLESIWIGVEILNLMGRNNIVSYYWVQDFNNIYYAVPNALSGRFFNVRCKIKF